MHDAEADDWEPQLRDIVNEMAWAIETSRLTGGAAGFMADEVLWARVGFRLRFERMAPEKVRSMEWAIRRVFLRCNKLAEGTNIIIVEAGSDDISDDLDDADDARVIYS
jgi:hypothetical protein